MNKLFEIILIVMFLPILILLVFIICSLLFFESKGSIIYWSKRVGANNTIFFMPKFRTMKKQTPQVASHLLNNPEEYITTIGYYLRKFSLDEVPQIYSIIKGDMKIIGPRPALYNQHDLITLRKKNGLDKMPPGITGWAQINGRDELSIIEKVNYEIYYLKNKSFILDLKIIFMTFIKVFKSKNVTH